MDKVYVIISYDYDLEFDHPLGVINDDSNRTVLRALKHLGLHFPNCSRWSVISNRSKAYSSQYFSALTQYGTSIRLVEASSLN